MSSVTISRMKQGMTNLHKSLAAKRYSTTTGRHAQGADKHIDVEALLSKPTWSVSSLLPKTTNSSSAEVSPKQLRHLLKLSALPPPKDDSEEANMLRTLSSQLHFVKEIQKTDTTGIEPLQSLRDETAQGELDAELGLEALQEALAAEDVRGRFHPRIRRRRDGTQSTTKGQWDVLGAAGKKTGRYFVVEGGK